MRRALRHKCLSDERTLGAVQNWTWPSLVLQWDPNNPEHRAEGHKGFQLSQNIPNLARNMRSPAQGNYPQGRPEFAELQEEGATLCFPTLFSCLLTLWQ